MSVSYQDVYDVFRDKSKEWELLELSESVSEEILYGWLKGAISRFKNVCKKNLLDRDETEKKFNVDLSEEEIDILAEIMIFCSLKPKINNSDLFKNGLSTKDYTTFSNANLLKAISERYIEEKKEIENLLSSYSYRNNDFEVLKP